MPFVFDSKHCTLLFAPDYCGVYRDRARPFSLHHLGLTFYLVSDCLVAGSAWQALLPVHGDMLPFIFKESCPYLANEHELPGIAAAALAGAAVDVDEAAPFFPAGADNLWHWLTESLPKLLALEEAGYGGQYIVPANAPVVDETLSMLGIKKSKLLPAGCLYRVRRLCLPPRLSGFTMADNMPLSGLLRQRLIDAVGVLPGGKRCYVRRIGSRKVSNEEDVLAVLSDFGFESMVPEELPLKEQLRHMTNVEASVMAHGANSSLALMQKADSLFIELFGNRYVSYNNLHAVRLLGLRYHALVEDLDRSSCQDPSQPVGTYLEQGTKADIIVDPLHLRILLEAAL